jgi:hypothetical protein
MQQALDAFEKIVDGCRGVKSANPVHKDARDLATFVIVDCREPIKSISDRLAQPEREWQGLTDEELHLQAATYATNRKNAYVEGMKSGEVDHMNEEALNGKWLAHYEGYREGYWAATNDGRYTTDPAKLKEKNG